MTNVTYGVTTLVVLANPVVNDANQEALPTPGTALVDVQVSSDDGPSDVTDTRGQGGGARVSRPTGGGRNRIGASGVQQLQDEGRHAQNGGGKPVCRGGGAGQEPQDGVPCVPCGEIFEVAVIAGNHQRGALGQTV